MVRKLIYIEWHDAFGSHQWQTNGEIENWKKGEFIIREVGWVIEETKKQIILAGRNNVADNGDPEQWGSLQKIPKTWIRKTINLTRHIK